MFPTSFAFLSFSVIYPSQSRLHLRGIQLKCPGSDACRGITDWIATLVKYTGAGLSECVVSTTPEPPPKTKQNRKQTKDTPKTRIEIKFSDSTGNRTRAGGLEVRDSTVHATLIDPTSFVLCKILIERIYNELQCLSTTLTRESGSIIYMLSEKVFNIDQIYKYALLRSFHINRNEY